MLSHVDENNEPTMVDVSGKVTSTRIAQAECRVQLPEAMRPHLHGRELTLKKGPVFQTAIIAGTMAAKRTHEIIPFCHPIALEDCRIRISIDDSLVVAITCEVKTTGKTGVEMEALHGATAAALTIYDMCKAVSHDIVIREARLVRKTGGKRTVLDRPLYGLVLTGGKSSRMKTDKALLRYQGVPQAQHLRELLQPFCQEVYLSARAGQWEGTPLGGLPTLHDGQEGNGPIAGLLAAFEKHPEACWLVVACDLPFVDRTTVEKLLAGYSSESVATAFANADEGFPEALCALYTPRARVVFQKAAREDLRCPVKILRATDTRLLEPIGVNLANINTPEEFREVRNEAH